MDIAIKDYVIHTEMLGSGPPLLLVHGGMGYGHRQFRPWLDPLAETHTLIYVDLPGNGGSSTPPDFDTWDTLEPLVESLHLLRQAMGYESWHVLGHSFGGLVVQGYALAHPEDFTSLTLSCTTPAMDHPEESMAAARLRCDTDEQFETLSARLLQPRTSDAEYDAIWVEVWPAYFAHPEIIDELELKQATGGSAAAHNTTLRIWPNSNMVPRLGELGALRTLVLGATKDWTFPPPVGSRRLHQLIPGSSYAEFAESGHYPFIEEQRLYLDTLTTWLAEIG